MTDLRAAMGQEQSDGPVLSALKTGDYTDAIVLAYTDGDKQIPATGDSAAVDALTSSEFANTEAAHHRFETWLRSKLATLGAEINLTVLPQQLKGLNDAKGIYDAAAAAVQSALNDDAEKTITTYVSPGTPIMAYTWALIARANPNLNIGVISSSNPALPPEKIEMPIALLDTKLSAPVSGEQKDNYDLIIHLLGEQSLPVYFGVKQFSTKNQVFLTTQQYKSKASRLAKAAGLSTSPIVVADPFNPIDTEKAILKAAAEAGPGAKIAINTTGGTKLMFAGALTACWQGGFDPFYFEIKGHNIIFLRDGSRQPFVGVNSVQDFISAADFALISDGTLDSNHADYEATTCDMWEYREELAKLYSTFDFRSHGSLPKYQLNSTPFNFSWGKNNRASFDGHKTAQLVLNGVEYDVPHNEYFKFLSGGWLEEYVYSLLLPLVEEGLIKDIRIGLEIGYPIDPKSGKPQNRQSTAQEFDCAFTDGNRLWVIECKAGGVFQEHIQKLENNLRNYGGVAAKGLLATSFELRPPDKKRVDGIRSITHLCDLTTDNIRKIILKN